MGPSIEFCDAGLASFVEDVRSEYWRRAAYDEYRDGLRQANTCRVVACQVLEDRSRSELLDILAGVFGLDGCEFIATPVEAFETSFTPSELLVDLICEVCWQVLMQDVSVRVEDEVRLALAEAPG